LAGAAPSPHIPPKHSLNLLSCGDRYAIASWGNFAAQGRWLWWLKDWIDRSFIKRYRRG
jgi:NADH dehydrogenase FAD-containing subunit